MDLGEEGSGRWDRNDKVFFFFGCTGSSLLHGLSLVAEGGRSGVRAQWPGHTCLVALRYTGSSSQTRDRTRGPRTGRQALNHWNPREGQNSKSNE